MALKSAVGGIELLKFERLCKKVTELIYVIPVLAVLGDYFKIALAKLRHDLKTYCTRLTFALRILARRTSDNGDCGKAAIPLGNRVENSHALGTKSRGIGAVFDVTPGEHRTILGKECRTYRKMRIW